MPRNNKLRLRIECEHKMCESSTLERRECAWVCDMAVLALFHEYYFFCLFYWPVYRYYFVATLTTRTLSVCLRFRYERKERMKKKNGMKYAEEFPRNHWQSSSVKSIQIEILFYCIIYLFISPATTTMTTKMEYMHVKHSVCRFTEC